MPKHFVKLAIDHGTTNSSIALMDRNGPRVICRDGEDSVMPSAVFYYASGEQRVGRSARLAMMTCNAEEGTGHTGYKPYLGQKMKYEFPAAGKTLTDIDLGAIVIRQLLLAYREKTQLPMPKACLITIPAKFDQAAADATRQAAKQAGLIFTPTLDEPIAAALAYGFTSHDDRANLLIFDIGGGTTDVSLVSIRDQQMRVPADGHCGDRDLGGIHFDHKLLDHFLPDLKRQYALDDFQQNSRKYGNAWGRLTLALEEAKIDLSTNAEAIVSIQELCKDDRGKTVDVNLSLSRDVYEQLIVTDVRKAVHLCRTLLDNNRMTPQDIDKVILVGGPSKTPLIRHMLSEAFGKEPDQSIDPMTAVVQGAVIYAATVEIPSELDEPPDGDSAPGQVRVTMQYEGSSKLSTCYVCGKVEGSIGDNEDLVIELRRNDSQWSSGALPVQPDGTFGMQVLLIESTKPTRSDFTTTVRDARGNVLAEVEEPQIWHPYPDPDFKPPLPYSLRIAEVSARAKVLLPRGKPLPARGEGVFTTTKPLDKGTAAEIRIPVMQGVTHLFGNEDPGVSCSAHIGTVVIQGSDDRLTRDLPEGSTIELTIHVSESREIHVVAYVPLLETDFEAAFHFEGLCVSEENLDKRIYSLQRMLRQLERLHQDTPLPEVQEKLAVLSELNVVPEIERERERAKVGERGALELAYRRVLELEGAMKVIEKLQQSTRYVSRLKRLESLATGTYGEILAGMKDEYRKHLQDARDGDLDWLDEAAIELEEKIRQPVYDVYVDVRCFPPQFRGTQDAIDTYREAETLVGEIAEIRGRGEWESKSQVDRAAHLHQQLTTLWPELAAWKQERGGSVWNDLYGLFRYVPSDVREAAGGVKLG